ncbi:MAG TPA: carbamoyltransferase [Candidatus Woesebacteria bacterium]|nr:carbamoyltransferase [Candidatus Woesebacteria bacterium]
MYILGISCYYHDSAACLLKDGKVVAAGAEERFTRKKHDNSFPINAITYCLDFAGIAMNEVDEVVFYEKPILKYDRVLNQYLDTFPKCYSTCKDTISQWFDHKLQISQKLKEELFYLKPVLYVGHHLSHAASAYYLSGFKKSVILTLDGVGEWATTTIGTGIDGELKIDKEIQFPHSLGLLYSAMTTYLGFSANDAEYKVMGLAAYGNVKPFLKHFDQLITQFDDGSYQLNMEYFTFDWSNRSMYSSKLIELFGHPARKPESKMMSYHKNIAASLQQKLEEVVLKMLNVAYETYKTPNLCLAGGVALNSVLNGKILSKTKFKNLYIPPDPSDAGGAMGAAFYVYHQKIHKAIDHKSFNPYLGPSYSWFQIKKVLDAQQIKYTFYESRDDLTTNVAQLVQKQNIIGWFQGRMEWGPRALGNRSILASAATTKMRDIINEKVKHREMFRPFAPVILEEHIEDYFVADKNLPISARYMLMVYPFKPKGEKDVPAVVHVDGSGRLQTLVRSDNPLYYELIEKYYQLTGVPIIINTSFNVRGEPIVCSPEDAVNCFLKTDIDYLVIDQYVCRKKD